MRIDAWCANTDAKIKAEKIMIVAKKRRRYKEKRGEKVGDGLSCRGRHDHEQKRQRKKDMKNVHRHLQWRRNLPLVRRESRRSSATWYVSIDTVAGVGTIRMPI